MDFFIFISEQWLLVSLLMILIYGFAFLERSRGGKPISAHEVTQMLNKEEAVLVDLREAKEFNEGHIAGSLHIPQAKLAGRMSELDKYKSKTIVLADKLGSHAGAVGKNLRKVGFQVNRLQGGVSEWSSQGLPLVKKK
jgi:rhodanese-related sulfurtransferase